MEKQKTTLIKPHKKENSENQENKNAKIIGILVMLLIGIILLTNSTKAVIVVCYFIGAIAVLFGIFHLIRYFQLKKQFGVEENSKLVLGVSSILIGIIIAIISSTIEICLRFVIGFTLLFNGIKKTIVSINHRDSIFLVEGIVLVGAGLYTILAENLIFQLIGALLIFSSVIDLITFWREK